MANRKPLSHLFDQDYLVRVARGKVQGHSIVHKFGRNTAVGTSFASVALGGDYPTPDPDFATAVRIKAGGDANDTAAGTGAREVTVWGIDETGAEAYEAIATAGASASDVTTTTFIRIWRAQVTASGTYATASVGSHVGDIVIENGSGGTDWATISSTDFPRSTTEIGVYTIPTGYTGYLLAAEIFADSSKTTETLLFKRENILETSAPFTAMRVLADVTQEGGEAVIELPAPIEIVGPADIGFMSKVSSTTAEVDVDFEILLIAD